MNDDETRSANPELPTPDIPEIPGGLPPRNLEIGGEVARGGMGAVLRARDLNIERSVAIKIMLPGKRLSAENLLRFVEEAKVTGQLEHPGIVPIYDLGTDDDGQPFYTMKFVQGVTLKELLAKLAAGDKTVAEKYTTGHLLMVFQKVCDAVAFAHSKGIVHRDLKPENIMLGDYGEVLVMDWGLAKRLGKDETASEGTGGICESVVQTMDGTIMGTPQFMAPEQAEGQLELIDERTDIYALGAILYNLLTLRPPVGGKTSEEVLKKVRAGEILPVSEEVPESLAAVAMKALTKERVNRYQSVPELQRDIEAYQSGFATAAERAGVLRQLWLLMKRHKVEFGLGGAALVALLVVAALSYVRIAKERSAALTAARNERHARVQVEQKHRELIAARDRTRTEADKAKAITAFLQDMLAKAKPSGREVTLREVLDQASAQMDQAKFPDPLVEAAIRGTIAETYTVLGFPNRADAHIIKALALCRRSLKEDHPMMLGLRFMQGHQLSLMQRGDQAEPLLRSLLADQKRVLGPTTVAVHQTMGDLAHTLNAQGKYVEAENVARELYEIEQAGTKPGGTGAFELAEALFGQRRYAESEKLQRATLDMAIKNYGKDVPPTQAAMRRLAMCLSAQGKNEEAAQLLHEVTQWSTLLYGADHPLTLYSKDTLGRLLMAMDKANEAEPLFREILAAAPKHASERRAMLISQSSVSLVRLLDKQNRKPEIAPVCREAVAGILNAIAEDEFSTDSQNHVMELVQLLEQQALLKEMEQLTRGYLKLVEQRLPKNDPRMPDAKTCLAFALHNQGKLTDAANLLRAAVVEARAIHGDDHFAVLNPLRELALVLAKKKEFMEAEVLGRAALAMAQRLFGPTDRNTAQTMKILADVLALAGKSTEAEQLRKQAAETAPKRP